MNALKRKIQFQTDACCQQRILDVVFSGHIHGYTSQFVALVIKIIAGLKVFHYNVQSLHIGLSGETVSYYLLINFREDGLHAGIVQTGNNTAEEGHFICILDESAFDVVQISITIQMVFVHVCNAGDTRREGEEAVIVFIGFHYDVFAGAHNVVRAKILHLSAYDDCGVQPGGFQHETGHRGRSGFAMGSGNPDRKAHTCYLRQHFGSADHGDLHGFGSHNFGIVVFHGGRFYHYVSVFNQRGIVTFTYLDPK